MSEMAASMPSCRGSWIAIVRLDGESMIARGYFSMSHRLQSPWMEQWNILRRVALAVSLHTLSFLGYGK